MVNYNNCILNMLHARIYSKLPIESDCEYVYRIQHTCESVVFVYLRLHLLQKRVDSSISYDRGDLYGRAVIVLVTSLLGYVYNACTERVTHSQVSAYVQNRLFNETDSTLPWWHL